jgi:hypothetical protein
MDFGNICFSRAARPACALFPDSHVRTDQAFFAPKETPVRFDPNKYL